MFKYNTAVLEYLAKACLLYWDNSLFRRLADEAGGPNSRKFL